MTIDFFSKPVWALCFFCPFWCLAQTWTQEADFPGAERDDGTSFVIGSTAYCGTGITAGIGTWADFYAFDMNTSTWSAIQALPTSAVRQYAVGFSNGVDGYVFGGTDSGIFFNDLWRYDPGLDTWTAMTSMPAQGRSGAMCFVIGNDAYILGGRTLELAALDDVWVYHMATDSWEQRASMPFGPRWRASSAALDGLGYLFFGRDSEMAYSNSAHRYEPDLDAWSDLEPFPGSGRIYVAMQVVGNHITTFSGLDVLANVYADFWQFDVTSQEWTALNPLPAPPRRGGISFSDGNCFYYTTGLNTDFERLKETWKASGLTGVTDLNEGQQISLYPNPSESICYLKMKGLDPLGKVDVRVCDTKGQTLIEYSGHYNDGIQIDISPLDQGVYIVQLTHGKGKATGRVVKL